MTYTAPQIRRMIDALPRQRLIFSPTPLHRLNNLSADWGRDIYLKREDMSGPSPLSGNKMRKLEFVLGEAVHRGIKTVVTYGAYQSNSAMQVAAAANICGLKAILYLGDTKGEGQPEEPIGNLLLDTLLGAQIEYVPQHPQATATNLTPMWDHMIALCKQKVEALNAAGEPAAFLPLGAAHPWGYVSDVLNYLEITEQSAAMGFKPDYIFHANSSGGTLPGLIAAQLLLGEKDTQIISINIRSWAEGNVVTRQTCIERVRAIFERLDLPLPTDEAILARMHIDENYMAPGYALPNPVAQETIALVLRREGVFLDPTYTGKGFSGLRDYVQKDRLPEGSRAVYIHSGGLMGLLAGGQMLEGLV